MASTLVPYAWTASHTGRSEIAHRYINSVRVVFPRRKQAHGIRCWQHVQILSSASENFLFSDSSRMNLSPGCLSPRLESPQRLEPQAIELSSGIWDWTKFKHAERNTMNEKTIANVASSHTQQSEFQTHRKTTWQPDDLNRLVGSNHGDCLQW